MNEREKREPSSEANNETSPDQKKKEFFSCATTEFFAKRAQKIETSYMDNLPEIPREFSQEIGGKLQNEYDAKCVELAANFLNEDKEGDKGIQEKNLSIEDVAGLLQTNEEFLKVIEENKNLQELMLQIEAVQRPSGKMSLPERIVLYEKLVGNKEDLKNSKDPEKRKLAVEAYNALIGKDLREQAMERMVMTKEKNEIAYVLDKLKIDEITKEDLRAADLGRKEDKNWQRLTDDKKEELLYIEKLNDIKNNLQNVVGKTFSNAELLAFNEHLITSIGHSLKDVEFEKKNFRKRIFTLSKPSPGVIVKDKNGEIIFEGESEKLFNLFPNEIEIAQKGIDGINNEWEETLIGEENKIIIETKEKSAELMEIAYQEMIDRKCQDFQDELEAQEVLERERNLEMEGGKNISELMNEFLEDSSNIEDFIKAIEMLMGSGILEKFDLPELKQKDDGKKKETKEQIDEETKGKIKEAAKKIEAKGIIVFLAVFAMIAFLVLEKMFKSKEKR